MRRKERIIIGLIALVVFMGIATYISYKRAQNITKTSDDNNIPTPTVIETSTQETESIPLETTTIPTVEVTNTPEPTVEPIPTSTPTPIPTPTPTPSPTSNPTPTPVPDPIPPEETPIPQPIYTPTPSNKPAGIIAQEPIQDFAPLADKDPVYAEKDADFETYMASADACNHINLDKIGVVQDGKIFFDTTTLVDKGDKMYSHGTLVPADYNYEINKQVYELVRDLVAYARQYDGYVNVVYYPEDSDGRSDKVYIAYWVNGKSGIEKKYDLFDGCNFSLYIYSKPNKEGGLLEEFYPGRQKEQIWYRWQIGSLCSTKYLYEQGYFSEFEKEVINIDYSKYDFEEDLYVEILKSMFSNIYGATNAENVLVFAINMKKKGMENVNYKELIIEYRPDFGGCELVFWYDGDYFSTSPIFKTSKVVDKK